MDPVSSIQTLASVVSYLLEVAKTMKENRTECQKLCEHTGHILDIIRVETKGNVPPKLELRLSALSRFMQDITAAVKELSSRSFLKRALWRSTISTMIKSAYTQIETVMQEFKFIALIDLTKMQHEHEEARKLDSTNANANFDQLSRNDQDIIDLMQIHSKQMQEAMLSLHQVRHAVIDAEEHHLNYWLGLTFATKHLAELPVSSERKFLEHGLHAMQRRSGRMKMIPDEFVITSLDVIVHQDRKLGAGGFAEVFEADWRGTRVAVKILEKGLPASAIQQEVNVWKRLRHPCILEFFGACPIADPPFMVCAYKEHGDAVEYLRHFPETDRRQLLSQSAQGLDYLHSNNVVHGDLKATNILIDSHGKACLSDFGLSRVKTQTATIRKTKQQQTQAGTVRWMAPEHMLTGVANKKTDIYSFAMTMYEVFTLLPPFASTPDTILFTIICDRGVRPPRPDDPEVEAQGFDDTLWELMTKCWAQEPNDRLDASKLSENLTEICTKPLRITSAAADLDAPVVDDPFGEDEPLIRFDDDPLPIERQVEQQWNDIFKNFEGFGVPQEVIEQDRDSIKDFVADGQRSLLPATDAVNNDTASLQSPGSISSPELQHPQVSVVRSASMARAASLAKRSPQGPRPPIPRRLMQRQGSKDDSDLKTSSELQRSITQRTTAPPATKESAQKKSAEDRLGLDVTPEVRRMAMLRDLGISKFSDPLHVNPSSKPSAPLIQIPSPQTSDSWIHSADSLLEDDKADVAPLKSPYEVDMSHSETDVWFTRGMGEEKHGDLAAAVRYYQSGCDAGFVRCLHRMGMAYLFGQLFVKQSLQSAALYLRRAADLSNSTYPQSAFIWGKLLLACFPGITIPEALLKLHIPVQSTLTFEGKKYLEQAASQDYAPALHQIAVFYEYANPYYARNPMKSLQYYRRASKHGMAEAYMGMSKWFLCGAKTYFNEDYVKARKCAIKAANAKLPLAEFAMGYYDEVGVGGPVDIESARRWYALSVEHGYKEAEERLRSMNERIASKASQPRYRVWDEQAHARIGQRYEVNFFPPQPKSTESEPFDKVLAGRPSRVANQSVGSSLPRRNDLPSTRR